MNPFSEQLGGDAEVRRVEMLFSRLPASIVAALIGIFLCFVILIDSVRLDLLKAWTVYMLSVFAARTWIWYMFGKADRNPRNVRGWEWLFAAGALFSGLGWGLLFGPLHPPSSNPEAQTVIVLLVIIVAFTGSVFLSLSNITFWLFILPTLIPASIYYAAVLGRQLQWPITAAVCCAAVLLLIQRTLYRSLSDNLARSSDAETLLAEQQAIFDSSPMGIAVLADKRIVKCNVRLGELLGRRIHDLATSTLQNQFVSPAEAEQFHLDSSSAFDKGRVAQGMYRLRRADGTQFWAELSGRRMTGTAGPSVWMIADVTLRAANERRARPREPGPGEAS